MERVIARGPVPPLSSVRGANGTVFDEDFDFQTHPAHAADALGRAVLPAARRNAQAEQLDDNGPRAEAKLASQLAGLMPR